ncbi:MAG: hypothetical protein AAF727_07755 [Pseudomonadota bacterium]
MSEGGTEDNALVGKTFSHPKAAVDGRVQARPFPVAATMLLSVLLGFVLGYMLSIFVAPPFGIPFGLGGAMTAGAVAVGVLMFRPPSVDEYAGGFSRTEAEVREALADIEARKK